MGAKQLRIGRVKNVLSYLIDPMQFSYYLEHGKNPP